MAGVYNEGLKLSEGTDYTLAGSALTFKKEYLSSLINRLGIDAKLKFVFTNGADQLLNIINYQTPELMMTEITIVKSVPSFGALAASSASSIHDNVGE